MVGFLFDSELGQHGRLSILFWTWAAWSAFYLQVGQQHGRLSILRLSILILNLGSMVGFLFYSELGQHGRLSIYSSWAAWSAFYSSELGQHGRLSIRF